MTVEVATSSFYHCESCGQTVTKAGNGAMSKFKQHLDQHPSNRMFKILSGANSNPNPNPNSKDLERQ
jgi:hypothetical protein